MLSRGNLPIGWSLVVDSIGDKIYFANYNGGSIGRVDLDGNNYDPNFISGYGVGLASIALRRATDQLYFTHTDGSIRRIAKDGLGGDATILTGPVGTWGLGICEGGVNLPPELVSFTTSTVDGLYGPGDMITITATYDEILDINSSITIVLDNGVILVLDSVSGNTISGTYTVGAIGSGQSTLDLTVVAINLEVVADTDGVLQTGSPIPVTPNNLGDTKDIVIDVDGPTVTLSAASSLDENTAASTSVTATLSSTFASDVQLILDLVEQLL